MKPRLGALNDAIYHILWPSREYVLLLFIFFRSQTSPIVRLLHTHHRNNYHRAHIFKVIGFYFTAFVTAKLPSGNKSSSTFNFIDNVFRFIRRQQPP